MWKQGRGREGKCGAQSALHKRALRRLVLGLLRLQLESYKPEDVGQLRGHCSSRGGGQELLVAQQSRKLIRGEKILVDQTDERVEGRLERVGS